jgi:Predicted pyridoxal phosphate-dependent enzyme apparently involved in regulation of cell wall biogenesis
MSSGRAPIPLSLPFLDEREHELVNEVLDSGRLSLGPTGRRFEQMLAEQVGARHAAAVSSGTAGLHLLVRSYEIGAGDEVITTPFSFASSTNCFLYEGATPVFADIDPVTWDIDTAAIEAAITPRTKAIVTVDIFGYPCELDPIKDLAAKHGLAVIDDACEALGAEYKGKRVGGHGVPAVFAFYPNKQMTTGEGGIVVTDSEEQWRLIKSLSNQGRGDDGPWLEHVRLGYNYRLDDLSAALGVAQLEKLDRILELRSQVAERYCSLLAGLDGVELAAPDDAEHHRSWFVFVVRLAPGIDRERVIDHLTKEQIATSRYLPCIHLQPYMRERFGFAEGLCPRAEALSSSTVALPFYTALEAEDQERVAAALKAAVEAQG